MSPKAIIITIAVIALLAGLGFSSKLQIYEIHTKPTTPDEFLKGDPNLNILPEAKRVRTYKLVFISEEIDSEEYRKRFENEDAIITESDFSGFDGKGTRSIVFTDKYPNKDFFDISERR